MWYDFYNNIPLSVCFENCSRLDISSDFSVAEDLMTMEEENFDLESLTKALPRVEEDGAKAVQMPEGGQFVTCVESLLSMSMKARGSTKQGEGKSLADIKDMLSQIDTTLAKLTQIENILSQIITKNKSIIRRCTNKTQTIRGTFGHKIHKNKANRRTRLYGTSSREDTIVALNFESLQL